jgi:formylglycine-generating enzyme required for sulfatase activity
MNAIHRAGSQFLANSLLEAPQVKLRRTPGLAVLITLCSLAATTAAATNIPVAADFDGDGIDDPAVYRTGASTWDIVLSGGGTITTSMNISLAVPVPADYDGDGRADIAVFRWLDGTWTIYQTSGGVRSERFGGLLTKPVPADCDGDGHADPAVYRPASGSFYCSDGAGGYTTLPLGAGNGDPLAGDFDGDGVTDVAVHSRTDSRWTVLGSTAGLYSFDFGPAGCIGRGGDLDGDAVTDLICYQPDFGEWVVRFGAGGDTQLGFLFKTGVPVSGDFDGDGLTDLALYYPDIERWYFEFTGNPAPALMELVSGGTNAGTDPDFGPYELSVDSFFMDRYEVNLSLWQVVYDWALSHGYDFDNPGRGKGPEYPAQDVNWYDSVKWLNARSERQGLTPAYYTSESRDSIDVYRQGQLDLEAEWVDWQSGYRLPTEVEWEYAARGGLSGRRFPWGDTISHAQANYDASYFFPFDLSYPEGFHPDFIDWSGNFVSPAGPFQPNGYGLYDLAGNMWEWTWDEYPGGFFRVNRGGCWAIDAGRVRNGYQHDGHPGRAGVCRGLRALLPVAE